MIFVKLFQPDLFEPGGGGERAGLRGDHHHPQHPHHHVPRGAGALLRRPPHGQGRGGRGHCHPGQWILPLTGPLRGPKGLFFQFGFDFLFQLLAFHDFKL